MGGLIMKFSDELRRDVNDIWEASFNHPFIKGVADGTLPIECFKNYLQQDAYYLTHNASVLALLSAKTMDLEVKNKFAGLAELVTSWEMDLHRSNFEKLGVTEEDRKNFKPAPTAYAYTSHMYRAAYTGTEGDVMAAILPCAWLYFEIGGRLQGSAPGVPMYEEWINKYTGDTTFIQSQIDILDNIAERVTEAERQRMREYFIISSRYEYAFWEMSYSFEKWGA